MDYKLREVLSKIPFNERISIVSEHLVLPTFYKTISPHMLNFHITQIATNVEYFEEFTNFLGMHKKIAVYPNGMLCDKYRNTMQLKGYKSYFFFSNTIPHIV